MPNIPICGHHHDSLFCPVSILPDPSPATKVKEQREGPVSPVLLEWCYLSAWFQISQQSGENWVLSFERGRSESKSALGHMKKRQRRSRAGTRLEAGETPEEMAFLLPVLLERSGQVWPNATHCDPFLTSDSQWHDCYFAASRTLLSLGSQAVKSLLPPCYSYTELESLKWFNLFTGFLVCRVAAMHCLPVHASR